MMLLGGSVAAPVSAWLVRQFDDRALGAAVSGVIILLNVDRLLLMVGVDPATITMVRLVVIGMSVAILMALVGRGRRPPVAGETGTA